VYELYRYQNARHNDKKLLKFLFKRKLLWRVRFSTNPSNRTTVYVQFVFSSTAALLIGYGKPHTVWTNSNGTICWFRSYFHNLRMSAKRDRIRVKQWCERLCPPKRLDLCKAVTIVQSSHELLTRPVPIQRNPLRVHTVYPKVRLNIVLLSCLSCRLLSSGFPTNSVHVRAHFNVPAIFPIHHPTNSWLRVQIMKHADDFHTA